RPVLRRPDRGGPLPVRDPLAHRPARPRRTRRGDRGGRLGVRRAVTVLVHVPAPSLVMLPSTRTMILGVAGYLGVTAHPPLPPHRTSPSVTDLRHERSQ